MFLIKASFTLALSNLHCEDISKTPRNAFIDFAMVPFTHVSLAAFRENRFLCLQNPIKYTELKINTSKPVVEQDHIKSEKGDRGGINDVYTSQKISPAFTKAN